VSRRFNRGSLAEAGVTGVLGAIGLYEGLRLSKQTLLWKDSVGPGWFLVVVAVGLLMVSAIQLFRGDAHDAKAPTTKAAPPLWRGQPFWLMVAFVAYTAFVPYAGYVIASFLFFTCALKISGVTTWMRSVLIGAVIAAVFYAFCYGTGIPLP
jgi:hypothetical protein